MWGGTRTEETLSEVSFAHAFSSIHPVDSHLMGKVSLVKHIEIVTPAPAGSLHGNRITALRWQRFLKRLHYRSTVSEQWSGNACELLIHCMACEATTRFNDLKMHTPITRLCSS